MCWAQLQRVEFDFSIPHFVVKPGNIRLDGDLGGGSFMDVGCYAVDLIRAAWGETHRGLGRRGPLGR